MVVFLPTYYRQFRKSLYLRWILYFYCRKTTTSPGALWPKDAFFSRKPLFWEDLIEVETTWQSWFLPKRRETFSASRWRAKTTCMGAFFVSLLQLFCVGREYGKVSIQLWISFLPTHFCLGSTFTKSKDGNELSEITRLWWVGYNGGGGHIIKALLGMCSNFEIKARKGLVIP